MKRTLSILLVFSLLLAAGCHEEKKISLQGEEPVTPADFVRFFEPLALPFTLADSSLSKRPADSLAISMANLKTMLPDSVVKKISKKGTGFRFYAVGKIVVPDAETYLLIRYHGRTDAGLLVGAFSKENTFVSLLEAIWLPRKKEIAQSLVIDRRYIFSVVQQRKSPDGFLSEGKEVYVFNQAAGVYTLIMTEALDEKATTVVNPIDTLAATHRFSADYTNGKMNLVSIRDGRKPDRISFFVQFEKRNGSCTGELKGEAFWKNPRMAEYRQDGDPCVLQFIFSTTSVSLREQRCGSRRGPDCLFDGSFTRKKKIRNKKKG